MPTVDTYLLYSTNNKGVVEKALRQNISNKSCIIKMNVWGKVKLRINQNAT